MIYKISSPAKINLGLKVLNKRADGFHNIETTFQFLNWGDDITTVSYTHLRAHETG